MAIIIDNIIIKGFSGTIGRLLTFKRRKGKTVVSKFLRPSRIPPTEKLVSVRSNFAACIAYAKSAIKGPAIKALYQAAVRGGQTAFNRATSDALNPPEVLNIQINRDSEAKGNGILIEAVDDFKVVSVTVNIQNGEGKLLKQGNAIQQENGSEWMYMTSILDELQPGSLITAIAMDLPGNTSSLCIPLN